MARQARKRQTTIKSDEGLRSLDVAPERARPKDKPHPQAKTSPLHNVPNMDAQEIVELTAEMLKPQEVVELTTKMMLAPEPKKKPRKSPFAFLGKAKNTARIITRRTTKAIVRAPGTTANATLNGLNNVQAATHWGAVLLGYTVVSASRAVINTALRTIRGTTVTLYHMLHPSSLAGHHLSFLEFTHRTVLDRTLEKHLFVPAQKPALLEDLTIRSTYNKRGTDYRPTPTRIFKWAMKALPENLSRFTFVDYGAGRGRVLLLATKHNFKKITGAEFAHELQEDALMNIAQFPRSLMKCRDIDCLNITATNMPTPEGQAVFYFFSPFDKETFSQVLKQIVTSYRHAPRRLYLLTVDYDVETLIQEQGIFEPLEYSPKDQMKQRLFSPLKIRSYKTIV